MTYDETEFVTDRERRIARWLAIGMHAGVVVLLVFGVVWQKRQSEPAAIVELWSSPAPPKAVAPPPPPRPPEPVIEPPRPKPAPPPPKPEVKPTPKPDIALKDKLEKERKAKEELEKKKAAELKKKEDDAKKLKAEAKKKEDALEKELQAKEAEAKRLEKEKADLAAKLAKEQAAAQQGAIEKYQRAIQARIRSNIIEPPNLQGNPEVVYEVRLLPGGDILEGTLRLVKSSGNPAYDDAVGRAILKSSPLPVPSEPALFQQFRDLRLPVRPRQ